MDKLWVESVPGEGSTFTFSAWFERSWRAVRWPKGIPPHLVGMRVLVVDDNLAAQQVLREMLTSLQFRVEVVGTGEEAVKEVHDADSNDPFGLVLMDWRMPGIDGITATRIIRGDRSIHNGCPIIVMSASGGGAEERKAAFGAGASDFLAKPLTSSTIVDALLKIHAPELIAALDGTVEEIRQVQPLAGARILLVEDNELNQQIARELLAGAGSEVVVASNGRIALQALAGEGRQFDLVLMDVQMPEMDGYEATTRIRSQERFQSLPIIAMTAHAMVAERQKASEMGMNDHISKPIDPEAMFATLARYFRPSAASTKDAQTQAAPLPSPRREPAQLPTIAGVEIIEGLRRVTGNRELYVRLLRGFADLEEETPSRIGEALRAGDHARAERLAHTLRGSAGNLGIAEVMKLAAALEDSVRNGLLAPDLEDARVRLASAVRLVVSAIRTAVFSTELGEERAAPRVDPANSGAVVSRLRRLIGEHDSDALEVADATRGILESAISRPRAEELRRLLHAYDFKSALQLIDEP